ncbi:MAG: hypothetical protein NXI01_09685 [Gammaproteobacteria bacterium]|nr:hypothetical protein [Gammaproteobacteria bacterium]
MRSTSIIAGILYIMTAQVLAAQVSGDVNFYLGPSPNNHAHKFRLIVDGSAVTYQTPCTETKTGVAQALSYGSIGQPTARLTVQAADCTDAQEQWITLSGSLNYDSNYWYELYVDMNEHSFLF